MRLRQPNMLSAFKGFGLATNFAHADERGAVRTRQLFQYKIGAVTAVAKGHPGIGPPQRLLCHGNAAVRATQDIVASATAQRAARFKLDIFADAPRFMAGLRWMLAMVLRIP